MATIPSLHSHYVNLIAELDKTLSMVRGWWMEAREGDPKRVEARKRLDELLDERKRLMGARDAAAIVESQS